VQTSRAARQPASAACVFLQWGPGVAGIVTHWLFSQTQFVVAQQPVLRPVLHAPPGCDWQHPTIIAASNTKPAVHVAILFNCIVAPHFFSSAKAQEIPRHPKSKRGSPYDERTVRVKQNAASSG